MEAKKVKLQIKLLKAKIANLKKKKKTRRKGKASVGDGRPQNRFERAQETIEAQNRQIREAELKKSLTTLQSLLPSRDELFTRGLQAQVTSQIQQQADLQKAKEVKKEEKKTKTILIADEIRKLSPEAQQLYRQMLSEEFPDGADAKDKLYLINLARRLVTERPPPTYFDNFEELATERQREQREREERIRQQRENEKRAQQQRASTSGTRPEGVRRDQPEPFVPFTHGGKPAQTTKKTKEEMRQAIISKSPSEIKSAELKVDPRVYNSGESKRNNPMTTQGMLKSAINNPKLSGYDDDYVEAVYNQLF